MTWGNVHPFQGYFEPTTQAFVDPFVLSVMSQWVTESPFFRSGNCFDLVFTSVIDKISNVNINFPFPHCGHCPIGFDYVFDFSYELNPEKFPKQAWWKGKYKKIHRALE